MKAILQTIETPADSSFTLKRYCHSHFNKQRHYHHEFELILIVKSSGLRFIGNSVADFHPGDLVLLGPDIPHWYKNDALYYEDNSLMEAESIVVQFSYDFLGDSFFNRPEASKIKELFERAGSGLCISGEARKKVTKKIIDMLYLDHMDRLIRILDILNTLSVSPDLTTLSKGAIPKSDQKNTRRINKIYEYVMGNYTNTITVDHASDLVNVSNSTFCRYFKKHTGKTFTAFLNEVRLGNVCKLLMDDDLSITEVCLSCGYNNISYFNRQFKALHHQTPQQYRNSFKKE